GLLGDARGVEQVRADGLQLVGGRVGDPDDLLVVQDLADGQRDRALIAADTDRNLVDVGQLVGGLDTRLGTAFIVLDDEFELAPEDAAGLVDFIGRNLHRLGAVRAGHRRRSGQSDDDADADRIRTLRRDDRGDRQGACKADAGGSLERYASAETIVATRLCHGCFSLERAVARWAAVRNACLVATSARNRATLRPNAGFGNSVDILSTICLMARPPAPAAGRPDTPFGSARRRRCSRPNPGTQPVR